MSDHQAGFFSRNKIAILVLALCLPIVLCGGLASWWFSRQAAAHQRVELIRAEIRARGLPLDDQSMTDFRARHMDNEKSNAWMKILRLVESEEFVKSCEGVPIFDPAVKDESSDAQASVDSSAQVRDFLDRWSELRKNIHDTTEGSGAIWTDIDFHGFATLLPLIQASRSVTRLLDLEYRDAIARNDHDQAFHSVLAMIGAARSLEAEPIIVSQLVHAAMLSVALDRLKQSIELGALDAEQLQQILAQLRPLDDYGKGYRLGIAGERAMFQPVFDDLGQLGEYDEIPMISTFDNRRIDALTSLEIMAAAEQIETEDLTKFYVDSQKWSDEFDATMQQANWLKKFDTVLTGLLTPAIDGYSRAIVRTAMQLRIAKIAIGLRLYQLRHGDWPDSLDELNVENIGVELGPITPIGDQPFGYRRVGETAELWGFPPEAATDVTPAAPIDPTTLSESEQKVWAYWHWVLPPK